MRNYLLSVIIPTRNRQFYCLKAVKQILSHNWNNVEICIQDNSDDDDLKRAISSLNRENVVYNYHGGTLSFVDNFSEAVSLAHGEYLCMIGDDDGILNDIHFLIKDMKNQNADAAIPALNYIYFWPSQQNIIENGGNGVLISHSYLEGISNTGRVVDCKNAIIKLLKNGVQNYTDLDIPRLYHGVVKKETLEAIKEKTGSYFGGLTPDMSMATALSLVCKKVIRVNYSVTISGICPTSGSSDSATGKHTGNLCDAPHFRGHSDYKWDSLIPSFYSVDTIWADTLLHTIRDFKRDDLIQRFNLPSFAAICIIKYPDFSNVILTHVKGKGYSKSSVKYRYYLYKAKKFAERVINKYRKLFYGVKKNPHKTFDVPEIEVAENVINKNKVEFS